MQQVCRGDFEMKRLNRSTASGIVLEAMELKSMSPMTG